MRSNCKGCGLLLREGKAYLPSAALRAADEVWPKGQDKQEVQGTLRFE